MKQKPISGIFPALTTPFSGDSLSVSALKSNIERYNRYDLAGYLVLGSTGESVLMDEGESLAAVEAVRGSAKAGRIVVAGTGMPSARATIRFTDLAAEAGADYGLVVTPFYYKGQMSAKALESYYREVAEHAKIPILMYSVPKFTGLDLPLETVLSLSEHPNIAGLKESSGNMSLVEEVLKACPKEFAFLQGMGSILFPSLMMGAVGGILAVADIAPAETVEIYRMVKAGKYEEAIALQLRILSVNQKIVGGMGVPGIKYAIELLGYDGGELRSPLMRVNEDQRKMIRRILEEADLLRS